MLQINMADVMNVIGSLTPYLIAIGVLFALALIITFAVNKKTVKDVATRKIVHSESWLVALVGIVVAVSMMLTGPLSTLLNNATITKYTLSDATVSKANELAKDVQSEAVTLLKNDDSNLPLSGKKVNVFGWGSTNPVYGGTGSGSMSKQYKTVSLLDGMKQAGLKTNTCTRTTARIVLRSACSLRIGPCPRCRPSSTPTSWSPTRRISRTRPWSC